MVAVPHIGHELAKEVIPTALEVIRRGRQSGCDCGSDRHCGPSFLACYMALNGVVLRVRTGHGEGARVAVDGQELGPGAVPNTEPRKSALAVWPPGRRSCSVTV